MTCRAGSLTGNTFHSAAIAEEAESIIVEEIKARLVEGSSSISLGNCEAHGVRETLSKRTSSNLYAISIVSFGVTWCNAIHLLHMRSAVSAAPES